MEIFEKHYRDYCRQVAALDFEVIRYKLSIKTQGQKAIIPFLGEEYTVSSHGVRDLFGNRPPYTICVVLFKYLLLCPLLPTVNKEWATLRDMELSKFTNTNVFDSDVVKPIINKFTNNLDGLVDAAEILNGRPKNGLSYDLAMEFTVLPKIDVLLLFNDKEKNFPASCSMLFQQQAAQYLDPESLIMAGIAFAKKLIHETRRK